MFVSAQVPYFQIFIKGKNGKSTLLWVKGSDLVDDIKCKIAFKDQIPVKEPQQQQSRRAEEQQQSRRAGEQKSSRRAAASSGAAPHLQWA